MHATRIEIVVKGSMGAPLLAAIEDGQGFALSGTADGQSHFVGRVADQARLYGVLAAFQHLGIELISVNPMPRGRTGTAL